MCPLWVLAQHQRQVDVVLPDHRPAGPEAAGFESAAIEVTRVYAAADARDSLRARIERVLTPEQRESLLKQDKTALKDLTGAARDADRQDVRRAYFELARVVHPDRRGQVGYAAGL